MTENENNLAETIQSTLNCLDGYETEQFSGRPPACWRFQSGSKLPAYSATESFRFENENRSPKRRGSETPPYISPNLRFLCFLLLKLGALCAFRTHRSGAVCIRVIREIRG